MASLQLKGISAACLDAEISPEMIEAIRCGDFNLVFGSPESLLNMHRTIHSYFFHVIKY